VNQNSYLILQTYGQFFETITYLTLCMKTCQWTGPLAILGKCISLVFADLEFNDFPVFVFEFKLVV